MNFALFCEFWCFSLGKQARFTLNFCSRMPLRKVHELTFLWFGLPGPLLMTQSKTRQRFHRLTEVLPCPVWKSTSPPPVPDLQLDIFDGGDVNTGERHSRVTRHDGTLTLCTLYCHATVEHWHDGPDVTAPMPTNHCTSRLGVESPPPPSVSPPVETARCKGKSKTREA